MTTAKEKCVKIDDLAEMISAPLHEWGENAVIRYDVAERGRRRLGFHLSTVNLFAAAKHLLLRGCDGHTLSAYYTENEWSWTSTYDIDFGRWSDWEILRGDTSDKNF